MSHTLNDKMVQEAMKRYGKIKPCSGKETWEECITSEKNIKILWFNGIDDTLGSTHNVMASTLTGEIFNDNVRYQEALNA